MKFMQATANVVFNNIDTLNPIEVYKKIEQIARVCYKSEGLITEDSHIKMISKLKKLKHYAMLEHHTFVCEIDSELYKTLASNKWGFLNYSDNKDTKGVTRYLISGSTRAWIESQQTSATSIVCKYLSGLYSVLISQADVMDISYTEQNPYIRILGELEIETLDYKSRKLHQVITASFVCDRGVSHELVRHRPCSFAQESTRYCNYSLEKFGGELSFILPLWLNENGYTGPSRYHGQWRFVQGLNGYSYMLNEETGERLHTLSLADRTFFSSLQTNEIAYLDLLELRWTPQQARDILPNSLKTEIFLTATLGEWEHFLTLRAADSAHPQMQEVAYQLKPSIVSIQNAA